MREAIFGVLLDRQMREECKLLQNISHTAFRDGNIDASVRIEQDALTHGNPARVRSGQPGHAVEQSGFSRSRRAEQYGEAGLSGEFNIERKLALRRTKRLPDAYRQRSVCGGLL